MINKTNGIERKAKICSCVESHLRLFCSFDDKEPNFFTHPVTKIYFRALEFLVYCPIQRNQFGRKKNTQINHRHDLQDEVEQ